MAPRISCATATGWPGRAIRRRRQLLEQHAAKHGLAAADFAGDLDDAFVLGDGVDQRIERGPRLAPVKKKSVCGVMRKGGSRRPKCSRYRLMSSVPDFHAVVERGAIDAEQACGLADVAAR
jgi:hypothetical protein